MKDDKENYSINKIPFELADPKNLDDIVKVGKSTIVLKYKVSSKYGDDSASLTEYREISLKYNKKIVDFEVELDEEDNIFIKVYYKKPFSIFGYKIVKQ